MRAMTRREHLHSLVDELPEAELPAAERVLEALATRESPLEKLLADAPVDDEPETDEERAAVAEAWREHREGKRLTTEQVRGEVDAD